MSATNAQDLSPQSSILRAALETIAAENISGTRMRLIAERAGMSQGNLHYYFPTKTSLFLALLEAMLDEFVAGRRGLIFEADLGIREKLGRFLTQKQDLLLERADVMQAYYDFWIHAVRDPDLGRQFRAMYATWRKDIQQVVEVGVHEAVFQAEAANHLPALLVAVMEGLGMQYLIDPHGFDLQGHMQAAQAMILGFVVQDGDV